MDHTRRTALLSAAALCLVLGGLFWLAVREDTPVPAAAPAAVAASTDNWGLSFQTEGEPPVGNATAQSLAQYDAYYVGDTTQKVLYLTFDCGYENGYTAQILDVLKDHQAPAAFFVVGHMIQSSPDLIRRMVQEGHIVGNHTFHHPDMSAISDQSKFQQELEELEQLYQETTGQTLPRFYRPPQGKYSEENLRQAQALGYRTVFWSLAYVDWYVDDQPTAEEAFSKLIPRIHNGAIVLLHSTSRTNAEILDELLTRWEDMGYTFASLEDLPDQTANPVHPAVPQTPAPPPKDRAGPALCGKIFAEFASARGQTLPVADCLFSTVSLPPSRTLISLPPSQWGASGMWPG